MSAPTPAEIHAEAERLTDEIVGCGYDQHREAFKHALTWRRDSLPSSPVTAPRDPSPALPPIETRADSYCNVCQRSRRHVAILPGDFESVQACHSCLMRAVNTIDP